MCPWNTRFAEELRTSEFAPREFLGGKDARQLARDLLGLTQPEFSAAFKNSPMKRAKLKGLKRDAEVVLGNVGTADEVDVLARALDDEEPLVREHAARALDRIRSSAEVEPPCARLTSEGGPCWQAVRPPSRAALSGATGSLPSTPAPRPAPPPAPRARSRTG